MRHRWARLLSRLLLGTLVLGSAGTLGAQASPASLANGRMPAGSQRPGGLVTLGLGGSSVGLAFGGLLGYRLGHHELAGRLLYSFKAAAFQGSSRYLLDAGLLYGFHPLPAYRALALRAGLSGVWYAVDPVGAAPKRDYDPVLGLPAELALSAPVGSKLTVGITAISNLNSQRYYAGLVLTLTFGNP